MSENITIEQFTTAIKPLINDLKEANMAMLAAHATSFEQALFKSAQEGKDLLSAKDKLEAFMPVIESIHKDVVDLHKRSPSYETVAAKNSLESSIKLLMAERDMKAKYMEKETAYWYMAGAGALGIGIGAGVGYYVGKGNSSNQGGNTL